ncbi:MAG: hypothetical protein U9Q98_02495 [Bacteroidota bacterium]|nr:hypothetical protein [Bacteroidota bacterium]
MINSEIGFSGQYQSRKATNKDYLPAIFQRYATGYKYQAENWSFGMNLYYMDHRFASKIEIPEYVNGQMMTIISIYSSRHLGLSPFVLRTLVKREKYSISMKLMPGIDNIFIEKQYYERYPSDNPDDVTVISDWDKNEYGNYDQINFNLTLALEASRSFNENLSISGGVFLFSYLHNNTRGVDIDEVFLPYAFGLNLGITYYFTTSDSSEN